MRMPPYIRRAIQMVIGLALLVVVGIMLLLGVLWLDHRRETTLPTPTGPFAVGRTTYVWSNAAHTDPIHLRPEIGPGESAAALGHQAAGDDGGGVQEQIAEASEEFEEGGEASAQGGDGSEDGGHDAILIKKTLKAEF